MNVSTLVPLLLATLLASTPPAHHGRAAHPAARTAARAPLRMLCLGDSYTVGEGVPEAERWPVQLAARLRARGLACANPALLARTGWSTGELSAAMDDTDLQGPYDLVTLLVGANDQFRGRRLDVFGPEFNMLLSRAVELAGNDARRVVVLSVPDWGVTPYGHERDPESDHIANAIDRYNATISERVQLVGCRWVDVTTLTRRHGDDARFLTRDGLHPSGAAYREWAAAVADTLRDLRSLPPR